jgi:hypothetical protein
VIGEREPHVDRLDRPVEVEDYGRVRGRVVELGFEPEAVAMTTPFFRNSIEPSASGGLGTRPTELHEEAGVPDGLMRRVVAATLALGYTGHLNPTNLTAALKVLGQRYARH